MKRAKKETFVTEIQSSAAFHIQPKNATQRYLLECIDRHKMTVVTGPAGTGKTYCTGMKAAQLFLKGNYDKIVLTRPNIPTGKSIGYFPGTLEEKMAPWLKPIMSVLEEGLGKGRYEYMCNKGQIEIQPMETIRGNSYENAIVLADEVQNLSMLELKALTTRQGEGTKLILMGDPAQSDLGGVCDLEKFVSLCSKHSISCPIVRFTLDDIVRSDLVKELLVMFNKEAL